MGGKAKPTKHSAKEINQKVMDSCCNRAGGAAGLADRLGGAAGHSKYKCPLCGTPANDLKTMQIHHEAKHGNIEFDAESYVDHHALQGGTTKGVAIRGSTKYVNGEKA